MMPKSDVVDYRGLCVLSFNNDRAGRARCRPPCGCSCAYVRLRLWRVILRLLPRSSPPLCACVQVKLDRLLEFLSVNAGFSRARN